MTPRHGRTTVLIDIRPALLKHSPTNTPAEPWGPPDCDTCTALHGTAMRWPCGPLTAVAEVEPTGTGWKFTPRPADPHAPYCDAVDEALAAADIAPDDGWTSTVDVLAEDGITTMCSLVLLWHGTSAPAADTHPDGLQATWDITSGWQTAALSPDGYPEAPTDLPLPLWARPRDVAAAVHAVLTGDRPPAATAEWDDTGTRAAVRAWHEDDGS
ncbi:hypothetical protein ACFVZ3_22085 [Kitasatospora purpeofusca]|uniref:hypothetical protein n=1 Tax=Kitasatospora purpeofusca TaxID=67352 RepID=UPI0036AB8AD5